MKDTIFVSILGAMVLTGATAHAFSKEVEYSSLRGNRMRGSSGRVFTKKTTEVPVRKDYVNEELHKKIQSLNPQQRIRIEP